MKPVAFIGTCIAQMRKTTLSWTRHCCLRPDLCLCIPEVELWKFEKNWGDLTQQDAVLGIIYICHSWPLNIHESIDFPIKISRQVTNKPPRSPSGDAMDPSPIEVGLKICSANAFVHPISWSLQKLVSHMCFLASFLSIHKLHLEGTEICLPVLWCCSFFSLDGFLYKLEMQCVPMRICILTS